MSKDVRSRDQAEKPSSSSSSTQLHFPSSSSPGKSFEVPKGRIHSIIQLNIHWNQQSPLKIAISKGWMDPRGNRFAQVSAQQSLLWPRLLLGTPSRWFWHHTQVLFLRVFFFCFFCYRSSLSLCGYSNNPFWNSFQCYDY
jgi:hypothetical protein